jgi:hypothetical protein
MIAVHVSSSLDPACLLADVIIKLSSTFVCSPGRVPGSDIGSDRFRVALLLARHGRMSAYGV